LLAFTSVYFLESGLFNGLQPFGIKILPVCLAPVLVANEHATAHAGAVAPIAEPCGGGVRHPATIA
jgi:hypothetical protein